MKYIEKKEECLKNVGEERIEGITLLRGILIVSVVFFHSLTIFVSGFAGHEQRYSALGEMLRNFCNTFQMPVFMAISGFFFYFEVQKAIEYSQYDIKKFLIKKSKRLLVPFIIIMFFWRKPLLLVGNRNSMEDVSFKGILKSYFMTASTGGLWFLYVLFLIFVIQYLLVKIIWKSKLTELNFTCIFVFLSVISYKMSGPIHHLALYSFYFFVGSLVSRNIELLRKLMSKKRIRVLFYLVYGLSLLLSIMCSMNLIQNAFVFSIVFTFDASVDIILALLVFSNKECRIRSNTFHYLGEKSMEIYLLHEPLMVFLGSFLSEKMGGWSIAAICFVSSMVGSIMVSNLIRKMNCQFVFGN